MEFEKENKRLKVLIIILLVFLVAFGGYYFYENVVLANNSNTTNNETSTKLTNYTYNNLKGLYTYNVEPNCNENTNCAEISPFELYLYDNGCFYYGMPSPTPIAFVGNYIINDDKVILTYWYGFDTSIYKLNDNNLKTNTLVINGDGSLLDMNPISAYTSEEKLSLVKVSTEEENNFLNGGRENFQKLISNYLP